MGASEGQHLPIRDFDGLYSCSSVQNSAFAEAYLYFIVVASAIKMPRQLNS